jgi:hypothetical protein
MTTHELLRSTALRDDGQIGAGNVVVAESKGGKGYRS